MIIGEGDTEILNNSTYTQYEDYFLIPEIVIL